MILSTIRTYNTISIQAHRIDVESQQPIFPYKAKQQPNGLHFQFYVILNRFTHIHLFGLFDIGMHSRYLLILTYRVSLLFIQSK